MAAPPSAARLKAMAAENLESTVVPELTAIPPPDVQELAGWARYIEQHQRLSPPPGPPVTLLHPPGSCAPDEPSCSARAWQAAAYVLEGAAERGLTHPAHLTAAKAHLHQAVCYHRARQPAPAASSTQPPRPPFTFFDAVLNTMIPQEPQRDAPAAALWEHARAVYAERAGFKFPSVEEQHTWQLPSLKSMAGKRQARLPYAAPRRMRRNWLRPSYANVSYSGVRKALRAEAKARKLSMQQSLLRAADRGKHRWQRMARKEHEQHGQLKRARAGSIASSSSKSTRARKPRLRTVMLELDEVSSLSSWSATSEPAGWEQQEPSDALDHQQVATATNALWGAIPKSRKGVLSRRRMQHILAQLQAEAEAEAEAAKAREAEAAAAAAATPAAAVPAGPATEPYTTDQQCMPHDQQSSQPVLSTAEQRALQAARHALLTEQEQRVVDAAL